MLAENTSWSITGVYGPLADADKIAFMQEILDLRQHVLPAWLLLGDFNLIYQPQDKNNARINLSMLNNFKYTIDNLGLAPIDLQGKRFTWCTHNDQNRSHVRFNRMVGDIPKNQPSSISFAGL